MPLRRRLVAPVAVVGAVGVLVAVAAVRLAGRDTASSPPSTAPSSSSAAAPAIVTRAGRITFGADPPWATRAQWPVRGRIESVTITGARSGLSTPAYVYLPPQYFQPRYAQTRFPAAEILTGYPGRTADLIQGINVPAALLKLIDAHRAQPAVLVMMRPAVTYPRDTECTDVPSGPQVQTFFASDVPAVTMHTYRVRSNDWGVLGISVGGYCAAKLAMLHPSLFPVAVSLSGYPMAVHNVDTGDLWGGSQAFRDSNDLDWRLEHLPTPPISLLLTMGSTEVAFDGLPAMRTFISLVKPPMRVASIVFPGLGHRRAAFDAELPVTLSWLCRHLPTPSGS